MKIIITGASGFLGRFLVEELTSQGAYLVLVGRNIDLLKKLFPNKTSVTYDNLHKIEKKNFDGLIHLAVANNDKKISKDNFIDANVNLFKKVLSFAKTISIKKVIYLSTLHVFIDRKNDYVFSKKLALDLVDEFNDLPITTIFLPSVYSLNLNFFKGKLSILNIFPKKINNVLFSILSSLMPVVDVKKVNNIIIKEIFNKNFNSQNLYITDNKDKNFTYVVFKKTIDILFVLFILVFFWWLLILSWLGVFLSSKGGGLFNQERVGKNEACFICHKFRTMKVGTEIVGTHEISKSSITRFGKFLRKTKIDELPQILNIIKDEISLVGPRPGLMIQKKLLAERIKKDIFLVKPGITGYAQINNVDMSDPIKLAEWDKRYIALRSIIFDLKIILKTFLGSGQGDKVNKKNY